MTDKVKSRRGKDVQCVPDYHCNQEKDSRSSLPYTLLSTLMTRQNNKRQKIKSTCRNRNLKIILDTNKN